MKSLFLILKSTLLALLAAVSLQSHAADDVIKTVYHMSEGIPQASRAMNNIRNHLAADPKAKIVPSGVAEVAKLQAREGFVYLRP